MGQFPGWDAAALKKVQNRQQLTPNTFDEMIQKQVDLITKPLPKSKYNNKRTIVDGLKFDSKKEAERYSHLKLLEKAGVISKLKLQQPYKLIINGFHVCTYISDFEYLQDGKKVIEDAKGVRTSVYIIKRKLMKAIYNIEIKET